MLSKTLIRFSAIGSFILCLAANANQQLTACGHHDYPPWNWKSDNKIVGVCAEVSQILFKQLAIDVDLTYVGPWKRCLKKIETGQVDINICSFINEKRSRYAEFIKTPMGFNEQALFVAKGQEFPFHQMTDLRGKSIGLVLGVSIGQTFDEFLEKNNIAVQRLTSYKQAFNMLKLGRVDVIPIGRYSGRLLISKLGLSEDIVELPTALLQGKLNISMSKSSSLLSVLPKVEQLMKTEDYNQWVESLLFKYTQIYSQEKPAAEHQN